MSPQARRSKLDRQARYRARLKHDALMHYGSGKCEDCDCSDESLLELHHEDGGGNKERDSISHMGHASPGGWAYYLWLRKNGYPPLALATLCVECHKKRHHGIKTEKEEGEVAV